MSGRHAIRLAVGQYLGVKMTVKNTLRYQLDDTIQYNNYCVGWTQTLASYSE